MDNFMARLTAQLSELFGPELLVIGRALAVLILGWLFALALAAVVKGALKRTTVDNRLAVWILGESHAKKLEVETWIGRGVYYVLLVFVAVAFFNVLNLTMVSQPLTLFLGKIVSFLPQVVAATVLLAAAWAIATVLRRLVSGALELARLDERIGGGAGLDSAARPPLSKTLSNTVYWLVFLLFLPNVLETLSLDSLLGPIQSLLDRILGFLPNVLAALVILGIGWFVARVIQRIVTNLVAAAGIDGLGERIGLAAAVGTQTLSGLLGLVVYVLILVPVVISALNALQLDAVTQPASAMLERFLGALPALFAAALLLTIAYFAARLVAGLITRLLAGAGFDRLFIRLGLSKKEPAEGRTPSTIVGTLTVVTVMLFASIEAAAVLGFDNLASLVSGFVQFAGQVILGLVVFGVGLYLANLAAETIRASQSAQSKTLSVAARVSILVLASAVALRQMGLANEIIELAFGALIGAVAVAAALAFGLGGRDLAAKQLATWRETMQSS